MATFNVRVANKISGEGDPYNNVDILIKYSKNLLVALTYLQFKSYPERKFSFTTYRTPEGHYVLDSVNGYRNTDKHSWKVIQNGVPKPYLEETYLKADENVQITFE